MATLKYNAELKIDSTRLCIFYPLIGTKTYEYCVNLNLLKQDEYDNFDELSIIKWDKAMDLFIKKVIQVYPWVLNIYLNTPLSNIYQELFQKALEMNEDEWEKTRTGKWIRENSVNLAQKCYLQKIPFYYNLFEDRPDVSFLYIEREKQFPNIIESLLK